VTGFLEDLFGNVFWSAAIKVVIAFALMMVVAVLLVWIERKLVADMQNRVGPFRAGPFGILQTMADGLKLLFKEQVTPRKVELGLYLLAPLLAMVPTFLIFLVIPIGRPFHIGQTEVTLQATDLNVAVLFFLAMSSLAVYAIVLAGWASGSKYPLLGGVRATAQMISYEVAMGLALVPVILFASSQVAGGDFGIGTMSMAQLVELQRGAFRPGWPRPSPRSWAGTTPSTPGSASPCSSWRSTSTCSTSAPSPSSSSSADGSAPTSTCRSGSTGRCRCSGSF